MNIEEYEEELNQSAKQREMTDNKHVNLTWQREYMGQWISNDDPPPHTVRQSGRTTRMVFQALIAASEGKNVYIVAHNARMAREIRRMVETVAKSIYYGNAHLPAYIHKIVYINDPHIVVNMTINHDAIILYDNAIDDIRNGF